MNRKSPLPRRTALQLMLAAGAVAAAPARAEFMGPDMEAPVARLIENVQRYAADHPDDARTVYVLARLHSLAYASGELKPAAVYGPREGRPPMMPPYDTARVKRADPKPELDAASLDHLRTSLRLYDRVVELDPKIAPAWLGRGWMLSEAARYAGQLDSLPRPTTAPATQPAAAPGVPNRGAGWYHRTAIESYLKAVDLAFDKERQGGMIAGDSPVSAEAAREALKLLDAAPPQAGDDALKARLKHVVEVVDAAPKAITPVVVPLGSRTDYAAVADASHSTRFDLIGDGVARSVTWVTPDTGILAWDPKQTGRIDSGRQLFGNSTWWMFWPDGYAALRALDDDGDGRLTGREFAGIAVWRDANRNGVSDPGEVVPVARLGITSLACSAPTRNPAGVLEITAGATFRDGSVRPTYDWVSSAVPAR